MMGGSFPVEICEIALERSRNDMEHAANWLIENGFRGSACAGLLDGWPVPVFRSKLCVWRRQNRGWRSRPNEDASTALWVPLGSMLYRTIYSHLHSRT